MRRVWRLPPDVPREARPSRPARRTRPAGPPPPCRRCRRAPSSAAGSRRASPARAGRPEAPGTGWPAHRAATDRPPATPAGTASATSPSVAACTSVKGRNSSPLRSKNGPPSGRRTPWKSAGFSASAADSRLAACSASSGVAPSITTIVSHCSDGKAALVGEFALPPLVLGRDQLGRVGGHGEMTGRIDQRHRRQCQGEEQNDERMPRTGSRRRGRPTRPCINSCGRASACASVAVGRARPAPWPRSAAR